MDEKLRALLEQMPEKPPRSKLEPHLEVIRQLRRKGRTYQEISQFFSEHLNLHVAPSTIFYFVQVRARRGQKPSPVELPPLMTPDIESNVAAEMTAQQPETDIHSRIEALKQRKPPEKQEKSRFEYNAEEPLKLRPKTQQQE